MYRFGHSLGLASFALASTLSLVACRQNVSGDWAGSCTNITYDISAPLELSLSDIDGKLSGELEILSEQLQGDGRIEGEAKGKKILFWTNVVVWEGTLNDDNSELHGQYVVPITNEVGVFHLKKEAK
jgi:hypothetical protein